MTTPLEQWLQLYETDRASVADVSWIDEAADERLDSLLAALLHLPAAESEEQNRALDKALTGLALRIRDDRLRGLAALSGQRLLLMGELYRHLGAGSPIRYRLLQAMAISGGPETLGVLAELLAESPPLDGAQVAVVFSPLIQQERLSEMVQLFPRVLRGLAHLSAAAAILDVANYLTRKQAVSQHPAYDLRHELSQLLGDLTMQLEVLEQQAAEPEMSAEDLSHRVSESVSLAVSLCDALALIGDRELVGKLHQALELRHRRIHTEAAYALAKLGEKVGRETLISLAAEPVARLRVLAYAEELGMIDQIPAEHRTAAARAEASLVVWLAEPTQLGIPPTRCELIDQRELYWPGFTEPIDCFLFRFVYELGDRRYENIGISGPLVHSLAANLETLSPEDVYAAYAGWQAEHEEIFEREVGDWDDADRREARHLEELIRDEGYVQVEPVKLGSFFGQKILITRASRDQQPGIVLADEETMHWFPCGHERRPIGATEAFYIYKGRKLLEAFN